jgi:uncharacterized membrane protein YdfJ with MMPL/SSD domain
VSGTVTWAGLDVHARSVVAAAASAQTGELRGSDRRPRPAPSARLDRSRGGPAGRDRAAGPSAPHRGRESSTFPQSLPVIQTYDHLQKAFSGDGIPANVVVKAPDIGAPKVRAAIADLKRRALASDQLNGPITIDVNKAATVASITIPVSGTGTDTASNASLATLRDDMVPATVGSLPNAEVGVAGFTAESKDFSDKIKSVAPLVFGFVLLFAFGLLLFAFRSLVIAATAILLNLLSVAAAYGVLVLVVQHGVGKGYSASSPPPASTRSCRSSSS